MTVEVLEITWPGVRIAGLAADLEQAAGGLLRYAEDALADVALTLWLFQEAQDAPTAAWDKRRDSMDADQEQERTVYDRLLQQSGADQLDWPEGRHLQDAVSRQASIEAKRQRWASGRMPVSYAARLPFIYAEAFLTSVDRILKALRALGNLAGVPGGVRRAVAALEAQLPRVTDVRDSIQHGEDRMRGRAHGRDLNPEDGVIVHRALLGDRYAMTIADGSVVGIGVTIETAVAAQTALQASINTLAWTGSARHAPFG